MLSDLYPRRAWTADLVLTSPWTGQGRPPTAPAWRLTEEPGDLSPVESALPWTLQWDPTLPVHVTPHGVVEGAGDLQKPPVFCLFCPEPGVLIGMADAAHRPHLDSRIGTVNAHGDDQELETPDYIARLSSTKQGNHYFFVLALQQGRADTVEALFQRYASSDPLSLLMETLAPYQDFAQRQASLQAEDFNRVQDDVFLLITRLRSSRDASRIFDTPDESGRVETLHIYALVKAWTEVRVDVATALMRTVLERQKEDGSLPRFLDAQGAPSSEALHAPILAHTLRFIWRLTPDRNLFDFAAVRIQRHLEYLANSLNAERATLPQWPSAEESLLPDFYRPDQISADLPALLIRDITALEEIADSVGVRSLDLRELIDYRVFLLAKMRELLWNEESTSFSEHTTDGRPSIRETVLAVLPLLCKELSPPETTALLNQLLSPLHLLASTGVQAWVAWPNEEPPPIRPIHQLLLLDALKQRNATSEATAIRSALLSKLPPSHEIASIALALVLLVIPTDNQLSGRFISPALLWLHHHSRSILVAAASLFLIFNISVFVYSCNKSTLTPQTVETSAGLAKRYYQEGRYTTAEELLNRIIKSGQPYPSAFVDMGNIQYRLGNWEQAEAFYRRPPPAPVPTVQAQSLHNLAVLLLERGRTNDAISTWRQIRDEFSISAPQIAAHADTALTLLGAQIAD